MYYMIYQTKCKVYNTKNNKYITLWVNSNPRIPFVTQDSQFVNESLVL